jgi:hypothetical protein
MCKLQFTTGLVSITSFYGVSSLSVFFVRLMCYIFILHYMRPCKGYVFIWLCFPSWFEFFKLRSNSCFIYVHISYIVLMHVIFYLEPRGCPMCPNIFFCSVKYFSPAIWILFTSLKPTGKELKVDIWKLT